MSVELHDIHLALAADGTGSATIDGRPVAGLRAVEISASPEDGTTVRLTLCANVNASGPVEVETTAKEKTLAGRSRL